jgi:SAM-dependent methyltransferase
MTEPHQDWNDSYTGAEPAPWDIGRPQPEFARLAEDGRLAGRLLDAGCGTGEQTLLAAQAGAEATGVDISSEAIRKARAKAEARGVKARFEVGNALRLADAGLGGPFGVIIDSGVFHVFDDADRARYVASLGSVIAPGGTCYLMCFSDRQPGEFGPRRVRREELRAAFADGWLVESIEAAAFVINPIHGFGEAQAWLATIRREGT